MSAVEVISDRAELEQVASRSRNKAAAKRARGILREAEERAARELAACEDRGGMRAVTVPLPEDMSVSKRQMPSKN